jgi:sugar (pentulose or hexulose) kinase
LADPLFLGVDLGTSSAKALLVGVDGTLVAQATVGYPMFHPRPGWAEHDPTDFYDAVVKAVRAAVRSAAAPIERIRSLAIVAQREPAVLVNDRLEPVTRSISWSDQRSASDIESFCEMLGRERYLETTGLLPHAGSTLANLLWMRRCAPDVLAEARYLLFPKDYVLFRLTGAVLTDTSTPGRSGMLDIARFEWSDDICTAADFDSAILPQITARPSDAWGRLDARAAGELGLAPGICLAFGGGDDPSAALGGGAIHDGDLCAGTGTCSSWRIVSDERIPDRSGHTELAPHVVRDATIREAVISSTGTSMLWCRDELVPDLSATARDAGQDPYELLVGLADEIEQGAGGVFFYPYLEGSLMPRFDPHATGVFFGITGGVTRRHLLRAVIEGITFQYPPTVQMLRASGVKIDYLTVVDGETESRMWNQLKADVMGIEVRVPRIKRAAGLGAAILAGLAADEFATVEDAVSAMASGYESFYPDAHCHQQYAAIRERYEEVYSGIRQANQVGTHTNQDDQLEGVRP